MAAVSVRLRVTVVTSHGDVGILVLAQSTDRVSDILDRLIRECGLPGGNAAWQLVFTDRTLPINRALREVVPAALDPVPLTLRPVAAAVPTPVTTPSSQGGKSGHGSNLSVTVPTVGLPLDEQSAVPTQELEPITTPTNRPRSAERLPTTDRRTTVRYYSRMNPDRVYPMRVVISREEIEIALQRHIQQRTTRVTKLAIDAPVEIEPVLPGCAVYPPKVVTRLGPTEEVFEFHVVPHVLGPVTGARLHIRQDYASLAEIELPARVVQRSLVLVMGLLTFFLPILSAALSHFQVDFSPRDEWNPFLRILTVFNDISPVALTVGLAALTGVLYWLTLPERREVFWDVNKPVDAKSTG
jgi:hypothetical protein